MIVLNKFKKIWPSSLRVQLILGIACILAILMSLLVGQLMNRQKDFFLKLNHDRAFGLSTTLASTANSYVISYELAGLQKLVSTYKNNPGLEYAMIISNDGVVLAHTDKKYLGLKAIDSVSNKLKSIDSSQTLIEDDSILDIATPIINRDEIIGWSRVGLSQEYIEPSLKEIRKSGLLFILISLIVGSIFAILVANRLSYGLRKLVSASKKIKAGNRNFRVGASRIFEIAELGTAFNQMLDKISSNEKLLNMVLENMPIGVWILDHEGNIESVNSAGEAMWKGIKYVGIDEYNLYKAWFTDTGKEVQNSDWGASIVLAEGRSVINQEIEIECFDKSHKIILNSAIPLRDKNEKIVGVITINVDITERKNTEAKVKERESLLTALFDNIEGSLVLYDVNKKIVLFNSIFASNYKLLSDHEPKVGDGAFDFLSEEEKKEPFKFLDSALKGNKEIFEKEYLINGKFAYFRTSFNPVINEGKVTGITSFTLDLTKNKEAEIKLRESEERYRLIIASSNTGAWEDHADTGYSWCSPEYFTMLGLDQKDFDTHERRNIRQIWKEFLHPDDAEIADSRYSEYVKNGSVGMYENVFRMRHANGNWLWILSRGQRLRNADGSLTNVTVGTHTDITDRKKAEDNLRKINHAIGERVKELNCLYRMSELSNDTLKTMEDILQDCADIIPPSYQYPDITCARIIFNGQIFESVNFRESEWKQEAAIIQQNNIVGKVEVFYKEQMKDEDEGPFLKEERLLIDSIADILGSSAERKNADAILKEQAETFTAIIENTNESIWLLSPDLKVLQFNKTAKERLQLQRGKEIYLGANFKEFLNVGTEDIFISMFNNAVSGKYTEQESYQKNIRGEEFWLRTKMYPVYDTLEILIGVTVLFENITDRKNAENELKESEEKFRNLVEQTSVGVFILQDKNIIYVNPGFESISGYSEKELLSGMPFQQLIYDEDVSWVEENHELRISGEKPSDEYILRAVRKDGKIIFVDIIVSRIIYNNKPAVIGSVIDKTRQVEEEKRIGRAVTDAQEKERTQIGMELHDNVKQLMAASIMSLDFAKIKIDEKAQSIEIIDNVKGYIMEAINELRRLSHQLAPAVDTNTGTLIEKIEKLVNDTKISDKMEVLVDVAEFNKPIDTEVQLAFYRIMQEQFTNILKYSKASAVLVRIKEKDHRLNMVIKDDGIGFDTTLKKDGIGLENIKRRINILNGHAEIIASPGEGCEVKVSVPFD